MGSHFRSWLHPGARKQLQRPAPPLQSITENIKSMKEVISVTAQTNITLETEIETLRDALLCKVEEYHTKKLSLGQTAAKVKMLQSRVEGGVLADQLVRMSVDNE